MFELIFSLALTFTPIQCGMEIKHPLFIDGVTTRPVCCVKRFGRYETNNDWGRGCTYIPNNNKDLMCICECSSKGQSACLCLDFKKKKKMYYNWPYRIFN